MTQQEIRKKFDEIVAFAEVERFLDTPVKRYSSGMYVRLAFAVAAHLEPEILIVDEVLAVGDAEFQKKCLGKMDEVSRRDERTILIVSHNIDLISRLCSRSLLLDQGVVQLFADTPSVVASYLSKQHNRLRPKWIRSKSQSYPNGVGLSEIEIIDNRNTPRSSFFFGEEFLVQIRLCNQTGSPVRRCFVGIEFLTQEGYSLLTTNSNDKRQLSTLPVGDSIIRCRVNQNPFMPGRYMLRAGLVDYPELLLDFIDPEILFEIMGAASSADKVSLIGPDASYFHWIGVIFSLVPLRFLLNQ